MAFEKIKYYWDYFFGKPFGVNAEITPEVFNENIPRLIKIGNTFRETNPKSQLWADYHLVAACYRRSIGNAKEMGESFDEIKEVFPDYDPSVRFHWKDVMPSRDEGLTLESLSQETVQRARVLGELSHFINEHGFFHFSSLMDANFEVKDPEFSIFKGLEEYFDVKEGTF